MRLFAMIALYAMIIVKSNSYERLRECGLRKERDSVYKRYFYKIFIAENERPR